MRGSLNIFEKSASPSSIRSLYMSCMSKMGGCASTYVQFCRDKNAGSTSIGMLFRFRLIEKELCNNQKPKQCNASLNPLCASKLDLELIDISWFERFIVANIEDAPQLSLDQIFSRREGPCVCKEDSAGGDMPAAAAMHSPHISSNPWALWRDIKRHTPSGAIPSSPRPSRVVKNVSPTPESGSSVLSARSILKKRETLKQVLGNVSSPLPLEAWVTGVKMTAAPEATEKSILLDSPREKNWKIFLIRVSSWKSVLPRLILGPKQLFFFLQARLARKAFYLATFFSILYNKRLLRQETGGACLYMPQDGH